MNKLCTMPECGVKSHAKGLCFRHYARMLRHGDPNFTKIPGKQCGKSGRKWKMGDYEYAFVPGHAISRRHPVVATHRLVLFNKIGPGIHPCSDCGKPVSWDDSSLIAHHGNENKMDNRPENLSPLCFECNCLAASINRQTRRREKFGYCKII